MLVSEFYYGRFEGDGTKKEEQKTVTFKCQSCLKVLKNNIRYVHVTLWSEEEDYSFVIVHM